MKQVEYEPAALKSLRRMPANVARRIVSKIEAYAVDPSSQANNVKRLKGGEAIRLRVGDWRIIMKDNIVLLVLRIGPRGDIYDR